MKVEIPKGEGSSWAFGDCEGFEFVTEIAGRPRRWTTTITAVLKHVETGKHYGYDWEQGNTESQENEFPDGSVELPEMVEKEVTTKEWVVAE